MRRLSFVLAAMTLVAACGSAGPAAPQATATSSAAAVATPGAGLRTLRLPMGYIPSVQYASFYVADAKGYFADEGLALEYDYLFETNGVQLVGSGELPFAVVSGEQVLLARAQSLPVRYVMAWFQEFPVAVIAKREAGISAPADLVGKTVGVPALEGASYIGLLAMLDGAGVDVEDLTLQNVGFNQVAALEAGQVDAVVVYANNEPIRLAAQGMQLNTIKVSDYASLAANGILTNEATLADDPELVRGFLRALLRGLEDALADPEGTYAIVKQYVAGLTDDALEQQVLAATMEMWRAERLGFSQPEAWETMQATMLASGLLAAPQDLALTYTNDYLP
ncbi:MAG: ABC transporter substrate-binding protein [Anaerolineales bacterium]|nr:ABC transporter substrate-binding protein [Anaerolineales bacterium]